MIFNREWAMPSAKTFSIPPIKMLLNKYVGDGKGWVDPYAGWLSPAEITNDHNPERNTTFHLDAMDFALTHHIPIDKLVNIIKLLEGKQHKRILPQTSTIE